mgnify:FL=1
MKNLLSLAFILTFSSSFGMGAYPELSFDQNPQREKPNIEEMVEKTIDDLDKKLNLSEEKSSKIKKILLDFHKAVPETMEKGEKEMKALESKTNEKVKAILTDKEYTIYLETMKKSKPNGPPRGRRMK